MCLLANQLDGGTENRLMFEKCRVSRPFISLVSHRLGFQAKAIQPNQFGINPSCGDLSHDEDLL